MSGLHDFKCEPCRAGAPTVTEEERLHYAREVPQWEILDVDGVPRLKRSFRFPDFRSALSFTNQVGEIAEAQGHHPSILTAWRRVTVSWWTHKIKGLHRNDFIMAARTDRLYKPES
jgi:4a-hydroxytetrahydrobiopterin dehydratase